MQFMTANLNKEKLEKKKTKKTPIKYNDFMKWHVSYPIYNKS